MKSEVIQVIKTVEESGMWRGGAHAGYIAAVHYFHLDGTPLKTVEEERLGVKCAELENELWAFRHPKDGAVKP